MKWYWIALIALAALTIGVIIGRETKKEASSPAKTNDASTTVTAPASTAASDQKITTVNP